MRFCLKRHVCFVCVLGVAAAGSVGVSSPVVAQKAARSVATNDQPRRTTSLTVGDGGKVVNPRGFNITVTGDDDAMAAGDSTEAFQAEAVNEGSLSVVRGVGIKVGTGGKVINRGDITVEGATSHGILVASSSTDRQSVIENHGTVINKGAGIPSIEVGGGGWVINYGTIEATGTGAGVKLGASTDPDPATGFAGHQATLENYGSIITMHGRAVDGLRNTFGGRVINWGTILSKNGSAVGLGSSSAAYQTVLENYGLIESRGSVSYAIYLRGQSRVINRGQIIARGANKRAIQVGGSQRDDPHRTVMENDGLISTAGDGPTHGIDTFTSGVRILNRGAIVTTGEPNRLGTPHAIYYIGHDPGFKTEELINEGSIYVRGQGANAIHATANSVVTNRGSLVSLNGRAINFTDGGNHLTLGSESYIIGNINFGTGTRLALDLSAGGSGLWQTEGTLTGDITATGGRGVMTWAYDKDTGQLAIFDASILASVPDTLAASAAGVSGLVGGRLDRLAGNVGGTTSRQIASVDGAMLTGREASVGVWLSTGGGIQQFDRHGTTPATTQVSQSGVLGVDCTPLNKSFTVGVFTGYVRNDTWGGAPVNAAPGQKRSFERDDIGVVGGVYGRVYHGAWFADASVSLGHSSFDRRRWTNDGRQQSGLSVLSASQDGWWVRPQVRVGHAIPLQGGWTATPSLSVSYGHQHLGGYTEWGRSGAAMEVKSRTVEMISGGGELALERAFGRKGTLRFHGGYDYRDNVGSHTTRLRLLGQDRSVSSDSDARHGFSAGIEGSYVLRPGVRVKTWVSALFGPDHRGGHGGLDLISHF